MKLHLCYLLFSAITALTLVSCENPSMPVANAKSRFNTYTKLPPNHTGSTYHHQGRYYTGGQYQTGRYTYQGRPYTSRYYHNGQYYYGGQHQNFPRENRRFQHGDFPAGNYQDGNYQGVSWNSPSGSSDR